MLLYQPILRRAQTQSRARDSLPLKLDCFGRSRKAGKPLPRNDVTATEDIIVIINDHLITYLEDLSCLTLTDDEKVRLKGDLGKIIGQMEKLNELDTAGVPELSHPTPGAGELRADELRPSLPREEILQNAPRRTQEMFSAPSAL